ncbi:hypothetical protein J2T57_003131 [Natronocella acetinitrilica]|jgi:hypothetical protein|uniref:DUF1883 domain-containing protein n=1 Tax=Natronocella acetinitrilica TaxID=414046 RepID=A0AAE3G520_9GAMM|nr:hypothetical protein [Natronocella acetinitrilica]MCP1675976.1 hypothetical protein [Natronocella acetinitrilica]
MMNNTFGMQLVGLSLIAMVALTACNDGGRSHKKSPPPSIASISASVLQDHWKGYVAEVPPNTEQLIVELHNLSQDADLYIQGPRRREYCESFRSGTRPDVCIFDFPSAGYWSIEVAGWDPGRTYYTLTAILEPPWKPVHLSFADQGLVALSMDDPLRTLEGDLDRAEALLPVIDALAAASRDGASGSFDVLGQADEPGHAELTPAERQGTHIKAAVTLGDKRVYLRTRAEHPLLHENDAQLPTAGIMVLRVDQRELELRFGADTGTGAALQIIAEPGPRVREVPLATEGTSTITLQPTD